MPAQFAALAPKVREFFETKAFGALVNVDDPSIIRAMSRPPVAFIIKKLFANAQRGKIIEVLEPRLLTNPRHPSETIPFPFSNPNAVQGRKCVFNYAPCTNGFEKQFAGFLDGASDVRVWCNIPESFKISIEYTDPRANLRYYYPDFVAVDESGRHWLIETKGAETVEVAHKDAARLWCDNATELSGTAWMYVKVAQVDFHQMQPATFGDITLLQ